MEYKIMLYVALGVLLGLIVSHIALYAFRKSIIKNTKACCAKCRHCSKSKDSFVCDNSGKIVKNLLSSGTTCELFES